MFSSTVEGKYLLHHMRYFFSSSTPIAKLARARFEITRETVNLLSFFGFVLMNFQNLKA